MLKIQWRLTRLNLYKSIMFAAFVAVKVFIMNEFDVIGRYFEKLTMGRVEAGGLLDDAAILNIPEGYELVVSSDTLNAGVHFMADAAPGDIAHKALRVNLSDLAAMGADPYCYQLNIAFPEKPSGEWLSEFTDALLADQKEFKIFCSGGDTTSIKGALSISMTVMGLVSKGQAVKRKGAKEGDVLVLTGPVGDALIGLKILRDGLVVDQPENFIKACYRPMPRVALSEFIRTHAHAAIDISDGLIADVGHVAKASGLGVVIEADKVPFSDGARGLIEAGSITLADLVTGGDDYELALAVPPEVMVELETSGVKFYPIGCFKAGGGVSVVNKDGCSVELNISGWTHF